MTTFVLVASLLVLLVLGILLGPLWCSRPASAPVSVDESSTAALNVLREQRAELERDYAHAKLTSEEYNHAKEELEQRAWEEGQSAAAQHASNQPARRWAVALGLLIPVVSVMLYLYLGEPRGLDASETAPSVAQNKAGMDELEGLAAGLARKLENDPQNIEGRQMLARTYMVLGKYSEAASVYAELARLQPQSAEPLANEAEALLMATDGNILGEPEARIARALAIDPKHPKTLALAGSVAFERQDFTTAIRHWETLLKQIPADDEMAEAIRQGIAQASAKQGK